MLELRAELGQDLSSFKLPNKPLPSFSISNSSFQAQQAFVKICLSLVHEKLVEPSWAWENVPKRFQDLGSGDYVSHP